MAVVLQSKAMKMVTLLVQRLSITTTEMTCYKQEISWPSIDIMYADTLMKRLKSSMPIVGSTGVGTHVYNRASAAGKRVQCMMGAKNHAVILPDANKEQ